MREHPICAAKFSGPPGVSKKVLHVHPLLKEEARAQALFATYRKMLGLTWDAEVDS